MARPLTLVHVLIGNRLVSGSIVQGVAAATGFAARGHRVTLVGPPGGELETVCAAAGVRFLPVTFTGALGLRAARAWRRDLKTAPPDMVHVHKGRALSAVLLAACGLGPRPLVVANRGVSFPLDRFNRWKYRHPRVRAVVCVADAVREVVVRSAGVRRERAVTIPAGTDVERFDPARVDTTRVRCELGLAPGSLLVGQVSVRAWKGWQELVAAFARISSGHPEARLLLVGCEPSHERERVVGTAREVGLADRLLILPYRTDMPEVLAACDVVVDASIAGTGITGTIREAMALERAVIATGCGGNRELVADDEVGRLVPPGDREALADALTELLAAPSLRRRLGAAARRRVVARFSSGQRLDRLEALYRRLVAAAGDARSSGSAGGT